MDILRAEIERKRKLIQDSNIVPEGKKYFKRSELIAKHEEDYLKKHAPQKLLELEKFKSKYQSANNEDGNSNSADESASTGDSERKEKHATSSKNVEALPKLSRREVIRRLRERGEPITVFAESELEAYRRLRKLEILEPEVNRGLRNDLQAALEQVDQAYLDEILKTTASASAAKPSVDTLEGDERKNANTLNEKKKPGDVQVYEDNLTFDEVAQMAKETFKNKKDLEGHAKMILTWLKFLLKTWGQHLNAREEFDKLSTSGKLASATYTQTTEYLRPLLRKLKSNTLTDDILEALSEIVLFMLEKEYIKANDAYLEMAIGNAPWPIGVTMVGIHARTGREKIFSRNVAHVMNDETQRKYIQGLKRLMTKCQIMFPTNPSKCVEYTPDATINS